MAENDIVRSLFGPTPNEVRQQNIANDNAAAHAYGMMTHQQRGAEGFNRAGAEIARGVAGLAGYVDPAEQRAQQEQAILSRYDTSTTEGMAQASQAAKAMGRYDLVAKIQQYHTGIQKQADAHEKTQSEILQNSARAEKMRRLGELKNNYPKEYNMALNEAKRLHPNDPEAEQAAMEGLINRFVRDPNTKLVRGFDANGQPTLLSANTITGGSNQVGGSSNKVQEHFVGVEGKPNLKQLQVLDPKTGLWVNQGSPIEAHGSGVNVKVDNITKPANAVAQFRVNVQKSIEPHYNIVTNADLGIAALTESLATGNFIDFNAARGSIAKAMGDTHISAADIKAAGGDPSLVGGFMDYLNKLGTGTPSEDTQKKMLATLRLLKKIASNKANAELSKQAKLGLMDNMSQAQVDAALDFPEFKPGTSKTPTQKVLKSGKTVTVEQD